MSDDQHDGPLAHLGRLFTSDADASEREDQWDYDYDAGGRGRKPALPELHLPRRTIALVAAGALALGGLGVGMIVVESNMRIKRDGLAGDCHSVLVSMESTHDRLRDRVDSMRSKLGARLEDTTGSLADRYDSLSEITKPIQVDCSASLSNGTLSDNTSRVRSLENEYRKQIKQIARFERRAGARLEGKDATAGRKALEKAVDEAETLLESTTNASLTDPYLRTRLSTTTSQARTLLDDDTASASDLKSMLSTLTDLTGQTRRSVISTDGETE